jgi:Fe2+ transport system protein FeoA
MATTLAILKPLTALSAGDSARIAEIRGNRALIHKLLGLGLRVGSKVAILHRRGVGLVLSNAESRIAIGGGIAEVLWVEPLADEPQGDRTLSAGGL